MLSEFKSPVYGLLLLSLLFATSCGDAPGNNQSQQSTVTPPSKDVRRSPKGGGKLGDPNVVQAHLRFEPDHLNVERVNQCEGERIETVRLINFGDTDEKIDQAITSCGCAKMRIPPGMVVPAGASLTLPVILKPWGGSQRKAQEVRLMLADGRLGPMLSLDVENVSPIRTIPSVCQRALNKDGRIRLIAENNEPLQLIGAQPDIPYSTLETEGVEVTLFVEWEQIDEWVKTPKAKADSRVQFDDDGTWDRIELSILTNHPNCPKVVIELLNSAYTSPAWH